MRVEPFKIVKSYLDINYSLSGNEWIDTENKTCCPLSALAISTRKLEPEMYERQIGELGHWSAVQMLATLLGFDPSYVLGFSIIIDGMSQADCLDQFSHFDIKLSEFSYGCADGLSTSTILEDKS